MVKACSALAALVHHRASALITSPPARVPRAFQVVSVDAGFDESDRAVHAAARWRRRGGTSWGR